MSKARRPTIAETLIARLNDPDVNLAEVAEECGLQTQNLYVFRAGRRGLSLDSVQRLADHFGLVLMPSEGPPVNDRQIFNQRLDGIIGRWDGLPEWLKRAIVELSKGGE